MQPDHLALYLGWAALYAAVAGGLGLAVLRLCGGGLSRAGVTLLFLVLFFVFLALHPFPDPALLDCQAGGKPARLQPFAFLIEADRLWHRGAGLDRWLRSLTLASAGMNFALCMAIGIAFGRLPGRMARPGAGGWAAALCFGAGLSLAIELTQLTGNWGLYPCPYRNFDVDDLILNTAGVMAGYALIRAFSRGRDRE